MNIKTAKSHKLTKMEGNQMSRNNLIVSLLCNNRGLDPAKFLGDVDDVKSLYINILTASGVGVSVKLNDEVSKWLSFAENFTVNDLSRLNEELVQKSVLFGNGVKPSEIDLIVFASVYSSVVGLSNSEREKLPHVMTWMYNIQLQLKAQESPAAVETQTNANPIAYANITANNCYWQWEEDKVLLSAWLNVSKDPLSDTDQTGDSFWNRVRIYCEENNPDMIKRGIGGIKKRWHRINKGAQAFGECHDQASREIKSGSTDNDIMDLTHNLFKAKYKKKCNFDRHWHELQKGQKWRSQFVEVGDSKRTKVSASGAYSSLSNSKTATGQATPMDFLISPVDFPVCLLAPIESPASPLDLLPPIDSPVCFVAPKDSPVCLVDPKDSPVHLVTPKDSPVCLVAPKDSLGCLIAPVDSVIRIQGSKATTRKNEEKLKEYESGCTLREEKIALKPTTAKKLALMSEFISVKEKEIDMQLLYADTSKMSGAQREIHAKLLEKFKEKYL